MNMFELFLKNNSLRDPDDIDSLLELAELVRQLTGERRYPELCGIINYTVEHSFYEAFDWVMEILQEELAHTDSFECEIGKSIPDYNTFMQRLQVDLNVYQNDAEVIRDVSGEVQSFFNIFIYETGYSNIRLVSRENFDTKDNDYIQYTLLFSGKK